MVSYDLQVAAHIGPLPIHLIPIFPPESNYRQCEDQDCQDISCTAAAISNNQTGKTGEMLRLSLV